MPELFDPEQEEQELGQPLEEIGDADTDKEQVAPSIREYIDQQSSFQDATPASVSQQPNRQSEGESTPSGRNDPNRVSGPDNALPGQRLSNDQLSGRISEQGFSQPQGYNPSPQLYNPANPRPAGARFDAAALKGSKITPSTGSAAAAGAASAASATAGAAEGAARVAQVGAGKVAGKAVGAASEKTPIVGEAANVLGGLNDIRKAQGVKGKYNATKDAITDVGIEAALDATGVGALVNAIVSKEDKRDLAKLGSGDVTAGWRVLKRHDKHIFYPSLLIAAIALFMGIGFGLIFGSLFGDPPGSIGLAGNSIYLSTDANPAGIYLDIMTDHLNITDPKTGKVTASLTLEATSGKYSGEKDAKNATSSNSSGQVDVNGNSIVGKACLFDKGTWAPDDAKSSAIECLANNGKVYDPTTGKTRQMTDDELHWYITARWPYVKTNWYTQGSKVSPRTVTNPAQPKDDFMGRKIVLYNPSTNKAIIGLAAEWGPAPWTGVPAKDLATQGTTWQYGPDGQEPRIQVPVGYEGRITGGGPSVSTALGEDTDQPVIMGFLDPDSKLGLGPVPDGAFHVRTRDGSTGGNLSAVPLYKQNNYPDIPYTSRGDKSQTIASSGCGIVSSAMVLSFYGKLPPSTSVKQFITSLAQFSVSKGFRTANEGTDHGYFPAIASANGLKTQDLTGNWDKIMTDIKAGIPVIVSGKVTKGDPLPFSTAGHYVVLTGITSDGRITVNDPAGGKKRLSSIYSPETIQSHYKYAVAFLK